MLANETNLQQSSNEVGIRQLYGFQQFYIILMLLFAISDVTRLRRMYIKKYVHLKNS